MPRSELVQSLLRGLDILKLISSKPEGMRLNELVVEEDGREVLQSVVSRLGVETTFATQVLSRELLTSAGSSG